MGFMESLGSFFSGGADKAAEEAGQIQAQHARRMGAEADRFEGRAIKDISGAETGAIGALDTSETGAINALSGARDAFQPYAEAGTNALREQQALQGLLGPEEQAKASSRFQTSPGYDFRLTEGINALDKSATARGNLYSGAAMKAVQERGEGLAAQEYGSYYDRFNPMVSTGFNAATGQANTFGAEADLRATTGARRADTILGSSSNRVNALLEGYRGRTGAIGAEGNALAAGTVGAANARSQGIGNVLSLAGTLGGAYLGAK